MYKIDWKKWHTAVQAAKGNASELTMLYSIRAHGRGRIHRRNAGLTWHEWSKLPANVGKDLLSLYQQQRGFTDAGGKLTLILTLEDQAAFIGERYKEFLRTEAQAA